MRGRAGFRGLDDFPPQVLQDLLARARLVAGPAVTPRELVQRWQTEKPWFAEWFNKCEVTNLAPSAVQTELTAYVVPAGCYGVLVGFANLCLATEDYANVVFEVDVDGVAIPGMAFIKGPFAPCLAAPAPMMDGLLSGQRVRVAATNLTTSTILNVQGYLKGWFWPAEYTPPPPAEG